MVVVHELITCNRTHAIVHRWKQVILTDPLSLQLRNAEKILRRRIDGLFVLPLSMPIE